MLAVIKTGGKQYLVQPGDKIKIEKINKKEGQETAFKEVLLLQKNKNLELGTPLVKGAKVLAKVLKHSKFKKVIVFRSSKKFRVKKGHRQPFTEVEITKIEA